MIGSRLYDQVLYAHGGGSYVIRLAEKVYAFTSPGEGNSHFSIDPWSFLKFGYFTEADDVPELPDILRKIDKDVKALTPENKWQYLCSGLTADQVKEAWEVFKRKYGVPQLDILR